MSPVPHLCDKSSNYTLNKLRPNHAIGKLGTSEEILTYLIDHRALLDFWHNLRLYDTNISMDYSGSSLPRKDSTAIRLEKWQDWPLWFDQLKIWCKRNEIWDDVNPEVCDVGPNNPNPEEPSSPAAPEEESKANFQVENAVYTNELRLWKEKDLSFKQLDENLKATVGDNPKQHLMCKVTEREKLKPHHDQVRPTTASIKSDLKTEYEQPKVTPYGTSVNDYFSRWHPPSAKCQTSRQSISVTGEEDPLPGLHEALQPIDPITAIFRINKVNDDINLEEN